MGKNEIFTDNRLDRGIDIALCINRSIGMADTIRALADGISELPRMIADRLNELSFSPTLRHLRVRVIAFGSSACGDEVIESPFFDFATGGADGLADFLRSIPLTHVRRTVDSIAALDTAFDSPWSEAGPASRRVTVLLSDAEIDVEDEAVAADAEKLCSLHNDSDGLRYRRNFIFTPANGVSDRWFDDMNMTYYTHTLPDGGCRDVDLNLIVAIMLNSL